MQQQQHGTELEQFRAQWRQEVAKRRPDSTRAAPRHDTHAHRASRASPASPAGTAHDTSPAAAYAPPPAAPDAVPALDDAPKGDGGAAYSDRLAALLDTLVPAHEAAAAAEAATTAATDTADQVYRETAEEGKRRGGAQEGQQVQVAAVSYTHLTLPTNREV